MAWDDDDGGSHPWKKGLWEARRSAREAYAQIPQNRANQAVLNAPLEQQLAHVFVIDYARHILPVAAEEEDMDTKLSKFWQETLTEVPIPVNGSSVGVEEDSMFHSESDEFDGGLTESDILSQLPTTTMPVSLSNIIDEWDQQNEFVYYVEYAEHTERHFKKLHLSKSAISACLSQCDRCMHDLAWLPEPGEKDIQAEEVLG